MSGFPGRFACVIHPRIPDLTSAILSRRSVVELFLPFTAAIERERTALTFEKRPSGKVCFKTRSTG